METISPTILLLRRKLSMVQTMSISFNNVHQTPSIFQILIE